MAPRGADEMKIVLKLTDACNLGCTYCYAKPIGRASRPVSPCFMSRLAETLEAIPQRERDVVFFGGEPLLQMDVIKAILAAHPGCRHTVNTNGTLVTDRIARFLADHGVSVSLALDGRPQAHDRHRRTRRGARTQADVVRAFERLTKAGVAVAVRVTVTPQTIGTLVEEVSYLGSIGVKRLGIAPAANIRWSRGAIDALGDGMATLAAGYASGSLPMIFDFERIASGGGAARCRPGRDTITISRDGTTYPCHRSSLRNPKSIVVEGPACRDCAARPYCTRCVPKLGTARPGPRCRLKLALVPAYDSIRSAHTKRRASMEKFTVIQGKLYKIPADVLKKYQIPEEEACRMKAAGEAPAPSRAEPPLKSNWYELGESDCF